MGLPESLRNFIKNNDNRKVVRYYINGKYVSSTVTKAQFLKIMEDMREFNPVFFVDDVEYTMDAILDGFQEGSLTEIRCIASEPKIN